MRYWFFDLDGTLADTDRDIREAWKAALGELGLACPDFETKFVAGPPIDEMAKALFPDLFTQKLADDIRTGFAHHYDSDGFPNTREYPGVMDAVRRLKARGDYVAIVTNKRFAGATAMAKRFGWNELFDGLYAGDMYAATLGKLRKGTLLAKLIAELGAENKDCTMVGDTISDFTAAQECGIRSIGVTWGYGKPEELTKATRLASAPADIS